VRRIARRRCSLAEGETEVKPIANLTRRGLLSMAMLTGFACVAHAQTYPSREVTLVVPFGIGGSTDIIGRQFAGELGKVMGAKVNVENKPGGTGTIGSTQVIQSKPDGYTIGFVANDALVLQPLLNPALVFKSPDDYQPVVKLGYRSDVLYVRADAPWKTYADFVADAKQNPGKMRVAIPGVGTLGELTVQKLNKVAGVRMVTVPFSGGGAEATSMSSPRKGCPRTFSTSSSPPPRRLAAARTGQPSRESRISCLT
jgi:tripartite-type tricarboxylate transporter receptor subunit TctC